MTSLVGIGVAIGLVGVVTLLHRGRGPRTILLRQAALTLLLATLLREAQNLYAGLVALDLLKRLVFLVTLASVLILVLTFRRPSISRRAARRIWITAGLIGLCECVLFWLMPAGPGGALPTYEAAAQSPAVFLYYALYETTIAAAVTTCAIGSTSALLRTRQPFLARLSLLLGTMAAVAAVGYVLVGWFTLVEAQGGGYAALRHYLFLSTITLLLAGIAVGGIRKIVVEGQEALTTSLGTDIVEPLWREVVKLHPGVMLPVDRLTPRERLLRLVVETNDALHLIRRDSATSPDALQGRDPADPRLTVDLLIHFLGESVVPRPLSLRTRLLVRTGALMADDEIASSVKDLYELRVAFATRTKWRRRLSLVEPVGNRL
ncbi:hypothetical protein [Actinomyces bowdenii]|uniref:Uncharacterized protein n=1 Tax=Actinomyces bowdenii TaxID=131109 RepID=A0A853EMS0_9ACTO|nr:hypothetical protein [Actinomyces bowdenii]MBF0697627.1 hypothetical protein [Actinomyces bowdenii]MDO5064393.1 hypothetical protein [Actinomyces bowdenii]NYS69800.1 hypothetical protein [Actinomyces bowdenii]